jgi:restriction system protein
MDTEERAVWGIHMGRPGGETRGDALERAENLQRQGYVALGWPDIGDLSELPGDRAAFRERFQTSYGESVSPSVVSASVGMLFRFVHVLQRDDIIVAPSPLGRIIRVGRISGMYEYLPSLLENYPNVRSVEWLSEAPLDGLGKEARQSLRAQRSLFRILSGEAEFRALASTPRI